MKRSVFRTIISTGTALLTAMSMTTTALAYGPSGQQEQPGGSIQSGMPGGQIPNGTPGGDMSNGMPGGDMPNGMPGGQMVNNVQYASNASDIVYSASTNAAADLKADEANATVITMSDTNNKVKIEASGTYIITGSCSNGNIEVKNETTDVVLILRNLDLTSKTGATVSIGKKTTTNIIIDGTVKLTDAENPADEESTDEDVADAFDGAAVKVKDGAVCYLTGSGTLTIEAGSCKNGIKVKDDSSSSLIIDGPTIRITAANDGINSGYDLTILKGNITVTAGDDGIHADRILTIDGATVNITSSVEGLEGTVVNILSGNITVHASDDGINAANSDGTYSSEMAFSINILGGNTTVHAGTDGLDSNGNINLVAGSLTIAESANNGGDCGIDYDGRYYVSDKITLVNNYGVAGPDGGGQDMQQNQPQQGAQNNGQPPQNTQPSLTDQNGQTLPFGTTPPETSGDPTGAENAINTVTDTASTPKDVVFQNTKTKLSASALASGKKAFSIISESDGGKVTVRKYKGNAANYIRVKSNGTVIVKKGTPKGRYVVLVDVAASGNYSAASNQKIVVVVGS